VSIIQQVKFLPPPIPACVNCGPAMSRHAIHAWCCICICRHVNLQNHNQGSNIYITKIKLQIDLHMCYPGICITHGLLLTLLCCKVTQTQNNLCLIKIQK